MKSVVNGWSGPFYGVMAEPESSLFVSFLVLNDGNYPTTALEMSQLNNNWALTKLKGAFTEMADFDT